MKGTNFAWKAFWIFKSPTIVNANTEKPFCPHRICLLLANSETLEQIHNNCHGILSNQRDKLKIDDDKKINYLLIHNMYVEKHTSLAIAKADTDTITFTHTCSQTDWLTTPEYALQVKHGLDSSPWFDIKNLFSVINRDMSFIVTVPIGNPSVGCMILGFEK